MLEKIKKNEAEVEEMFLSFPPGSESLASLLLLKVISQYPGHISIRTNSNQNH